MPRRPRGEQEDAIHHVFARGVDRRPLYRDDADCQVYLTILRGVLRVYGWKCLSYCLMTNHVHLLIETSEPNLGTGMQRLHGTYASFVNRRHDRSGHLFEGRFKNVRIKDDDHLWTAVAYVANNPVDAGLCTRAADWKRSSCAATLGLRSDRWIDTTYLLRLLEQRTRQPVKFYAELVG